jgi:hypothetical protein
LRARPSAFFPARETSSSISGDSYIPSARGLFFPCVLAGLSRAPQFVPRGSKPIPRAVLGEDVDAVIVPADACGGAAVLGFSGGVKTNRGERNKQPLIIAVGENETVLRDMPESVHIEAVWFSQCFSSTLNFVCLWCLSFHLSEYQHGMRRLSMVACKRILLYFRNLEHM